MINALDTVFDKRPESLDGVGVAIANNVDLFAMLNCGMVEAERRKALINWVFIGENLCRLLNVVYNHRDNGFAGGIFNCAGFQFSISLNHTDYGCFAFCPAPTLAGFSPAEIGFVNLDFPTERVPISRKEPNEPACTFSRLSYK